MYPFTVLRQVTAGHEGMMFRKIELTVNTRRKGLVTRYKIIPASYKALAPFPAPLVMLTPFGVSVNLGEVHFGRFSSFLFIF